MTTIDKTYSVANSKYVQFKVQMGDGAVFSAYLQNFNFNVKQMTKVVDGTLTDVSQWGGQWFVDIGSSDINVVEDAIWLMANDKLKMPDGYKCFSKGVITKAMKKIGS